MKLSNFVTLHADFETYFSPIAMKSGSSSLAKNFAAVFFADSLGCVRHSSAFLVPPIWKITNIGFASLNEKILESWHDTVYLFVI